MGVIDSGSDWKYERLLAEMGTRREEEARRQLLKLGQFHFIQIQLDNWTQHVDTELDVNVRYHSKFGYNCDILIQIWIQIVSYNCNVLRNIWIQL